MSIKIDPTTLVDPKLLGIPYKLHAKTWEESDCIGIAILFMREHGLEYEYDDNKGPIMAKWWETHPRRFLDAFLEMGVVVKFPDLKKFDCLLLMGEEQNTFPSCVGIMVDDRHFMCSLPGRGSFVDQLNMYWKSRFWSAIRLHKVTEKFGA